MKKKYFLLAFCMLISLNFNLTQAADNFKLHSYGDSDSDASLLVSAGTYGDAQTAQKAIYHYDVSSPWKFGTYEFATQKFLIYSDETAYWGGTQWQTAETDGICPIVYDGHSFVNNPDFSPVIFFVAPVSAIYKVNASFQYQSSKGQTTTGSSLFQFKAKDGSAVVDMNFGKNYTDQSVLTSDFYVNLHAGDTITFNQTCTLWGDPFCQWTKLQVLGNDNGYDFTSSEANASGFYFDNYVVATDFSFLNTKIADSETLIASTEQNSIPGTYPQDEISTFRSAIDAAKNFVANRPDATQLEINAQLATLTTAYTVFYNSFVITVNSDAANNYKLFSYGDADSDAALLIKSKAFSDLQSAQKAIVLNDVETPWRLGSYETATQAFLIYSEETASWDGSQWQRFDGTCPIVYDGHSFVFSADYSPVIFFVAPKAAIYLVSTNFQYQSSKGQATEGTNFFQFKANDGSPIEDMNFGGYYTQDSPTILADFFVNLHAGDTIAFNQSCTLWGDPYCQWANLQVLGNEDGVAYTSAMANGFGSYFDHYAGSGINKTEANNMKIISIENGIHIITNKVAPVSIYNIAGVQIKNFIVNSDEVISLVKGAYIVKSGDIIQKVIVR